MFVNEIAVGAFSFMGRCNYRPSSVYFILLVLFFPFFSFYLHIRVLVRTSGHMIVMWLEFRRVLFRSNQTINLCNYRPSSVYFILFVLFFPFFFFLFAYLRFGSHFRSHDSHVTGEHMVELGAIFFVVVFFCKSKQFFNVQGHEHCILKVTSLVQVQEAVFRE